MSSSTSAATLVGDSSKQPAMEWDWDFEHADRKKEAQSDASSAHLMAPFQVDRKVLKDVVKERMGVEAGRIQFLSAGTFHKAYLITLVDARQVVARVARRFMPRLKIESEVATLHYLRTRSNVPVPTVYHYDSNPYNRLGGEYILMSKARGIPLAKVYHSMSHDKLLKLLDNLALLVIPLFGHRFSSMGSLYSGPPPPLHSSVPSSTAQTPRPSGSSIPFFHTITPATPVAQATPKPLFHRMQTLQVPDVHIGPIVSWPFFGSGRGDLTNEELDRGPWRSTHDYLLSVAQREIHGVIRENEGKSAPHKLRLDPDEVHASRHHKIRAVPGDASDESTEWDWEESEGEWEGPGDHMYRDYRRMQRSTFLVAHLVEREQRVREEMDRWVRMMERMAIGTHYDGGGSGTAERAEEFAMDCHDLSLENIFIDEDDHSKITCIIDWESTATRPLWASAHVPPFLQASPFTSRLFRSVVHDLATRNTSLTTPLSLPLVTSHGIKTRTVTLATLANEWLHHEATGARMRMAHRCAEWDGWEEGLVESILGPEEEEEDWFKSWEEMNGKDSGSGPGSALDADDDDEEDYFPNGYTVSPPPQLQSPANSSVGSSEDSSLDITDKLGNNFGRLRVNSTNSKVNGGIPLAAKVVIEEREKEKLLNATGDICGGRGGELGRRLEAWLSTAKSGQRRKDHDGYEY
ncbi:hypothetical protein JAAARDRAFT_32800 [Jaapia argillacea MUCL 33604]|uniref:Aminoglycoside phosphotransferase domain-containing protein n=1 Tax=Jaapia argillacea MUCL 33604 TaxID=933084 RepID=A0A067Q000_9AGAM|nr:hypothetical protein JAAARDRAFT_32800 [Jaapia argillacea MUCL 33604]